MRKYRNQPTEVDGVRFASKAEAKRYQELKLLARADEIRALELQPRFPLTVNGVRVATYVADFSYAEPCVEGSWEFWEPVIEDVKGVSTPLFKLKAKLFEAQYGRKIKLITRN